MSSLTTRQRNGLRPEAFALPSTRQYPIHDAAHVRAATARLEQNKFSMPLAQYREARRNIRRAAKKFGVDSMYAKRKGNGR